MKITFLGTGTSQGVPVIACGCSVCKSQNSKDKRLRSSILIEINNNVFVVDAGPDFRQQLLRAEVKKLDAIILTHGHKDHIGGLDDVRSFNYIQKRPVDVYLQKEVREAVKNEFSYAFTEHKYPGVPEINMITIKNQAFEINKIEITPIEGLHYKMPVLGYRIGDFSYITDVNYISEKEKEKIKGSEVLVLGALRKEKHYSHFNLEDALNLIDEIKPKKSYLTHISHQMGMYDEVEKELPENVFLAYDGLTLKI